MDKWHQAISVAFVGVVGLFADGNFNTTRQTVTSAFHLIGILIIYTTSLVHKHLRIQTLNMKKCGK